MRERVEAMKAIWTEDEAEYHGEYVDFDPIWSWPKPAQKPHPPILVGGNGRTVLERVLAYGDEWMPNRVGDEDQPRARIAKLQRRAREEAGRDARARHLLRRAAPDRERARALRGRGGRRAACSGCPRRPSRRGHGRGGRIRAGLVRTVGPALA